MARHLLADGGEHAWVDLSERHAAGEAVGENNVRKHRNDVARLLQVLPAGADYALPEKVHADMTGFVVALEEEEAFDPKSFNVDMTKETIIERFRKSYLL